MARPKRNHWWPQLQSKHWTRNGLVHVARSDGTFFTANPINIGVEGDLYTRFDLNGSKDVTIEKWFSSEIEGPFSETLDYIAELPNVRSEPFIGNPRRRRELGELGFVMEDIRQTIRLPTEHRISLSDYLAALLVRNPRYIGKLQAFHSEKGRTLVDAPRFSDKEVVKTVALDNMLHLFSVYRNAFRQAHFVFVRRECDREFLFSDAGLAVSEPWRKDPIPFDIHAPLTPDLAIEILPLNDTRYSIDDSLVCKLTNAGVTRYNRIIVGNAERFVFSRAVPPTAFIKKHFGRPAPEPFAHRFVNGQLETKYDRSRDR